MKQLTGSNKLEARWYLTRGILLWCAHALEVGVRKFKN